MRPPLLPLLLIRTVNGATPSMKQTLAGQVGPGARTTAALLRTLETFNTACNAIAGVASSTAAPTSALQRLVYYDIRERFGFRRRCASGRLPRWRKPTSATGEAADFSGAWGHDLRRAYLLVPARDRVSLLTLDGRVEVPFRFGAYASAAGPHRAAKRSALPQRRFLPGVYGGRAEPTPDEASDYLGVDLGVITSPPPRMGSSSTIPPAPSMPTSIRYAPATAASGQAAEEGHQERQAVAQEAQRARKAVCPRCKPLYEEGPCQHGERHPARDRP